jgi:hypothetical protein
MPERDRMSKFRLNCLHGSDKVGGTPVDCDRPRGQWVTSGADRDANRAKVGRATAHRYSPGRGRIWTCLRTGVTDKKRCAWQGASSFLWMADLSVTSR